MILTAVVALYTAALLRAYEGKGCLILLAVLAGLATGTKYTAGLLLLPLLLLWWRTPPERDPKRLAGALASFIAAGTSYANHGIHMIPFYIFYSMFGFQRVGDLIWAAGDSQTRGFLMGGTSGRTTLAGEGLQHQDGQSQAGEQCYPPLARK